MNETLSALQERLDFRERRDSLRSLRIIEGIDFSSNDYLGLARSTALQAHITQALAPLKPHRNGSGGSRLLSGNTHYAESLEQWIADFHNAAAGLIFNSGYDANVGLFSCVATRHDTIIYDELAHASIIDGVRLSRASAFKFSHNDLQHLEDRLQQAKGNIFVAVESVYSMDGDIAPLAQLQILAEKYGAQLIVDEAHATGIFGPEGRGLVEKNNIGASVFARVHTFGKALGVHGAIVLGSPVLRQYLLNFARSFVYTTALPQQALVSIRCAYEAMRGAEGSRTHLALLIDHFHRVSKQLSNAHIFSSPSPIQGVLIPGNIAAKELAVHLQQKGFDVRPILSPTVPAGKERLRICLHHYNSTSEIDELIETISIQLNDA